MAKRRAVKALLENIFVVTEAVIRSCWCQKESRESWKVKLSSVYRSILANESRETQQRLLSYRPLLVLDGSMAPKMASA